MAAKGNPVQYVIVYDDPSGKGEGLVYDTAYTDTQKHTGVVRCAGRYGRMKTNVRTLVAEEHAQEVRH